MTIFVPAMDSDKFGSFIIGRCQTMCPVGEMKMREKEKLLHVLEMTPGTENHRKPTADPNRAVKVFNRSAVGKTMTDENYLRPPDVLLKTVHYLLDDVIHNTSVSWIVKYNFINDRMRSIRQDIVIQNVSRAYSISLLQPIVRFYAYSAYKLCDEQVHTFDPYLNKKHLQECLNRLLVIYDETEELLRSANNESGHLELIKESRPHFEALYIILNLGTERALHRVLGLSTMWRTALVQNAFLMALNYLKCNYIRVCRYMKQLPPLLSSVAVLHLPELRRKAFQIMSIAYSSKNLNFPLNIMRKLLLYGSDDDLIRDCMHYGINAEKNAIHFAKTSFKNNHNIVPQAKVSFVEKKLKEMDESCIFLFNDDTRQYPPRGISI